MAHFHTFPIVACPNHRKAPVHLDVGGTIYTTTLETLTKCPGSRLAQMFSGAIPIVVDSLKQHYFIDRDGEMFRHILNYLRNGDVSLSEDYKELDLLIFEAQYYGLHDMVVQLREIQDMQGPVR